MNMKQVKKVDKNVSLAVSQNQTNTKFGDTGQIIRTRAKGKSTEIGEAAGKFGVHII